METLKRIGILLLIIFFPLGILYLLIHTLSRDFRSFLGSLLLVGVGVLIGVYIFEPQIILNILNYIKILIYRS
jgi:hypothetical protein